jgi:hypothetical protein
MAYAIPRLNAAVADEAVPPCRSIPTRLDARAIYKTLLGLGIKLPTDDLQSIAASGRRLEMKQLDCALDEANIPLVQRLRFKHKLSEFNLISRGRPVSWPNSNHIEKPVKWADRFK